MQQGKNQTYLYLTDKETGELVRIPADRLKQYRQSRSWEHPPVSEADKRRMLERLKAL